MSVLRLTITPQFQSILDEMKSHYPLLSDAEMIKLAVSQFSVNNNYVIQGQKRRFLPKAIIKKTWSNLSSKGQKSGEKFFNSKKVDVNKISEEEAFNLIKNA